MRVAHVITRLIVGGAQENTLSTALGLGRKPGVDVCLIAGPSEGPEGSLARIAAASEDLEFHQFSSLVRPVHPVMDPIALLRLASFFHRWQPDIVHTHSGKGGILGRFAARLANVPFIVHTIHGPSFGPFQGRTANALFTTAERMAGRVTDRFVTVADAMSRQYLAAGIGRTEQFVTVRSGFDLGAFERAANSLELRRRLGIGDTDFVVGKIARLFKLKGHDDLFSAAQRIVQRVPNVRFLLVGDGEWRGRFESMAAAMGLADRFIFTGLVPPERVADYVGIMDALAHLSYREGLPRALPQAMAAGKPVIAYDCDGAGEVCMSGETGFLIRPGDLAGLVNAIGSLADDPKLRRQLGAAGREMALREFSIERLVEGQYEVYQELLSRRA